MPTEDLYEYENAIQILLRLLSKVEKRSALEIFNDINQAEK
ncbi:hypothetical protein [Okeania sp. SIO3B5]|nr:hypothetical protein [Okeania sp. SIO3B5]